MTAGATCAYDVCRCPRPYSVQNLASGTRPRDPNDEYCSERCEHLATTGQSVPGCECGHIECTSNATPDIPPMQ